MELLIEMCIQIFRIFFEILCILDLLTIKFLIFIKNEITLRNLLVQKWAKYKKLLRLCGYSSFLLKNSELVLATLGIYLNGATLKTENARRHLKHLVFCANPIYPHQYPSIGLSQSDTIF